MPYRYTVDTSVPRPHGRLADLRHTTGNVSSSPSSEPTADGGSLTSTGGTSTGSLPPEISPDETFWHKAFNPETGGWGYLAVGLLIFVAILFFRRRKP